MSLPARCTYIVFDMDCTLTRTTHDYEEMRRLVGTPPGEDTLRYVYQQPNRDELLERIYEWELSHAKIASANDGARALLDRLRTQGHTLGILTRNAKALIDVTLKAAGLEDYFDPSDCLGREDCKAKPAPDGVLQLQSKWGCQLDHMAIIGDYAHDLGAGRAAGIFTVCLNEQNRWPSLTDLHITHLEQMLRA
ncbi:MAG: HAD-IA family hydrolase [Gammaproteobacteria bacterium]|nr:HAD-IA family hydrolase [Gammaproteobacteria bacterium]